MSFLIAGLDEVGRGAVAGPMLAVAAMFKMPSQQNWDRKNSPIEGVNDSKTFTTHAKRVEVYNRILRSPLLVDFGIGHVTAREIDEMGIDEANRHAFYRAWSTLTVEPNFMLVDGDKPAPAWNYSRQQFSPKGDGRWWPVGAASILAKVIRDTYMIELGLDFTHYRWSINSGYGTQEHMNAIKHFGPSPFHRQKFIKKALEGEAA